MKKAVLGGALFLSVLSCQKDKLDFDMLDDLHFSPGLKIPLVNAHLNLNDLVKEDSILRVDPDNSLRIVYREDNLFEFGALEFVEIPEQDPTPIHLKVGDPPFELGIGLGTLGGVELSNATFETGMLRYTVQTAVPVTSDVEFTFRITNATVGGTSFLHTFVLPQGSTSIEDSVNISSIVIDLSNGGSAINYLGLKAEITDQGNAPTGQDFDLSLQLSGLEIEEANGFFGQKKINIPNGQFDFDISGLSEFTEGLYLANPTIKLITAGNLGFGIQLSPDFFGVNKEGNVASLDASDYYIPKAENINEIDTNVIVIDQTNSEIVDFLASLPKSITYGGYSKLNPNAVINDNYISRDSRMSMGLEINIPMDIRAENMRISETVDDINIGDEGEGDQIESITLYFRCENGFPFDVDLFVSFIDEDENSESDTISIPLLTAAEVDGNGKVIEKNNSTYQVELTDEDIDDLLRSEKIRITGILNTSNNGQTVVRLFTDYELDVSISTQTKFNFKP